MVDSERSPPRYDARVPRTLVEELGPRAWAFRRRPTVTTNARVHVGPFLSKASHLTLTRG